MAPRLVDDFTGNDGDPVDSTKHTASTVGAGSTVSILGNCVDLHAGPVASFGSTARLIHLDHGALFNIGDQQVIQVVRMDASAIGAHAVYLRSSNDWFNAYDPTTGYCLQLDPAGSGVDYIKMISGSQTGTTTISFASLGVTYIPGNLYVLKGRAIASAIQLIFKALGDPDPAWTTVAVDTSYATGGMQTRMVDGSAATARDSLIDWMEIDDLVSPAPPTIGVQHPQVLWTRTGPLFLPTGTISLVDPPPAMLSGSSVTFAGSTGIDCQASGAIAVAATFVGSSALDMSASGTLCVGAGFSGSSIITTVATGVIANRASFIGSAAFDTQASGAAQITKAFVGSAAVDFLVAGTLVKVAQFAGSAALDALAAGVLAVSKPFAGSSAVDTTATGAIAVARTFAGSSTPALAASGALAVTTAFVGSASITTVSGGTLGIGTRFVGNSDATLSASAAIELSTDNLSGTSAITFAASGVMRVASSLAGATSLTAAASAALAVGTAFSGAVVITTVTVGAVGVTTVLGGSTAVDTSVVGSLATSKAFGGSAALDTGAIGSLATSKAFGGSTALDTSAIGSLVTYKMFGGSSDATFTATAFVTLATALQADTGLTFAASSPIAIARPFDGTVGFDFALGAALVSIGTGFSGSASVDFLVAGGLDNALHLGESIFLEGTTSLDLVVAGILIVHRLADPGRLFAIAMEIRRLLVLHEKRVATVTGETRQLVVLPGPTDPSAVAENRRFITRAGS